MNRFLRNVILVVSIITVVLLLCGCGAKQDSQSSGTSNRVEKSKDTSMNTDKHPDYLVLVDNNHPVPENWLETLEFEACINSVGDDVYTETEAYEAYLRLKKDVEAELKDRAVELQLDSAFRSTAAQQKIVDEFTEKYGADYVKTYVAVPGYSEHHTGLALDLYFIIDGKLVYENEDLVQYPEIWEAIHKKLPKYGFILRFPEGKENITGVSYEPWHIRYVGSPETAREITDKGLTLEEYLGK